MSYMSVLLFNPCNDIALIRDTPVFTPPAGAQAFARAGASLPLWLAGDDDFVLNPWHDSAWYDAVAPLYGLRAGSGARIPAGSTVARPWGWSRNTVRALTDAGMPSQSLPGEDTLARHRGLSHRRTARRINAAIADSIDMPMPPQAVEARTPADAQAAIIAFGGRAIVKAPYSSSGRGILDTTMVSPRQISMAITGIIRRQGSVTVESRLDRVCDFAMLFESCDGSVRPAGYSLFDTSSGAYTGNILAPDNVIRDHIGAFVGPARLHAVEETLPAILTGIIGDAYDGPLGVDMLVYRTDGGMRLAPCIELNLRMTMGVYAHRWRSRFMRDGSRGTLSVRHMPTAATVPPVIRDRQLVSGTQSLIPYSPQFSITVTVT